MEHHTAGKVKRVYKTEKKTSFSEDIVYCSLDSLQTAGNTSGFPLHTREKEKLVQAFVPGVDLCCVSLKLP